MRLSFVYLYNLMFFCKAKWSAVKDCQDLLRAEIETQVVESKDQLQNRVWLLHWGLFYFFNVAEGRNELIDLVVKVCFVPFCCCCAVARW